MVLNSIQFLAGLVISLGIGAIAYRRRWLTQGGVFGAVLIGTLTFGLGGLSWAMVVVAFFVSSSLLTHYRSAEKHEPITDRVVDRSAIQASLRSGCTRRDVYPPGWTAERERPATSERIPPRLSPSFIR